MPHKIVPDSKYPNMYRIVLPDGRLSDMLNLSRAKDASARFEHIAPAPTIGRPPHRMDITTTVNWTPLFGGTFTRRNGS